MNQAIGRVIRHIKDFGAVYLCDQRYASQSTIGISKWMRDRKRVFDIKNIGKLEQETIAFFRDNMIRFGHAGAPKPPVNPETATAEEEKQKRIKEKIRCKKLKKRELKERAKLEAARK